MSIKEQRKPEESDSHQSDDEITKSRRFKRAKAKPSNESRDAKEVPRLPYSDKMAKEYAKNKSECKEVQLHKRKENEREKVPQKEYYQKPAAASSEQGKYSDKEVSEKPVHKPKKIQPEFANESSSTSTGEKETSEVTSLKSTPPKYKASATHTKPKVQAKNEQKEIEIKKGKCSGIKKKIPQEKSKKEDVCCHPNKEKHSKDKKGKRAAQVLSEKTRASIPLDRKSVKTQGKTKEKQTEKKREKEISAGKNAAALECTSDSSQEDSEDEESDSDDSSEDEEDRDPEEESSNEEEGIEPDDESSPTTSEEEVKEMTSQNLSLAVYERGEDINKGTGKRKEKGMKVAADVPHISCVGKNKECKPKPKEKKRRHRESSMSPAARGSSSPSTSPEDSHSQPRPKEKRTKEGKQKIKSTRKQKKEHSPTSSEINSSSPECDMENGLSETEKKKLSGIFSRFFGKLCCAIVKPVEIAAKLQEKYLISKATMIKMLKSSESQQEKTIYLVSILNKKIDSHPHHLFVFIEVLLQSHALQREGNEMLNEAGKQLTNIYV